MAFPATDPGGDGASPACNLLLEQAASAFAPIRLSEMDGVQLMDRVDTKYVLRSTDLLQALAAVAAEYHALEIDQVRLARYATLYFDTPGRECYLAHHNGRLNRHKFRMRSYGPSGPTFFEVKRKTNKGRTNKRRIPVPVLQAAIPVDAEQLIRDAVGRPLTLGPVVWTCFTRLTLVSNTVVERVTIDTEIEFQSVDGQKSSLPGVAIIEVKQPRFAGLAPVSRALGRLRVRPRRLSKYCIGSILLDSGLKRNRFKRHLRTLESLAH